MWNDVVQRLQAAEHRMLELRREQIGIEDDAARVITETIRRVWRQLHLAKQNKAEKKDNGPSPTI